MEEELEKILKQNAIEYYENAIKAELKTQYNSFVTLFFKSLSSLCDLFVLLKIRIMPSNHNERFRILETKFPEIYKILDRDFPFYQGTYKSKLNKEVSELLKNDVKRLFEILNINM